MRFQAEEGTTEITVGGATYTPDEHGHFAVDNPEHYNQLRVLGCRGEDDPAPAPVAAAEPPEVPAPYMDEETVRALVEENEDMRQGTLKLQGELSDARTVEDQLRDRIQELEGQLAAAATEKTTEPPADGEGGAGAPATEKTTETAPPAAKKAK